MDERDDQEEHSVKCVRSEEHSERRMLLCRSAFSQGREHTQQKQREGYEDHKMVNNNHIGSPLYIVWLEITNNNT